MKYFVDAHGQKFAVIELVNSESGVWVHYRRVSDNVEFTCLLDAFNDRFDELKQ
jgi:hypothetical protein